MPYPVENTRFPACSKRAAPISVLPICGVSFETFRKLFGTNGFNIPVAIITDSDPPVKRDESKDWHKDIPELGGKCDRLRNLEQVFAKNEKVKISPSIVTLEYDLALAGPANPSIIAGVWESCFTGTPGTLTKSFIDSCSTPEEKALTVWRGICRAKHSGSKAEFAHSLAYWLEHDCSDGRYFKVPEYIQDAVEFVTERVPKPPEPEKEEEDA